MVDQDFCLDLFDLDGTSISNGIPRNGFLEASKQNKFGLIKQFIEEREAVVDITDQFLEIQLFTKLQLKDIIKL